MLKKIKTFILDTLFPVNCFSCSRSDVWLCDKCLKKIPAKLEQVCPVCERRITPDGRICFPCRKKEKLDALLIASSYKIEIVARLIHNLKYRFAADLDIPLGKLLIKALLASQVPLPDLIIPVPLHKRRRRSRGFNQAELLARYVSKNLTPGFEIPMANNILRRRKYTRPQMEIKNYFQRKKNIENAFRINRAVSTPIFSDSKKWEYGKNLIKGRNILLIDDVATTGSTLFECARVLKKGGAKSVFACVIARQEMKKK